MQKVKRLKPAAKAVLGFLVSPQARRYEIPLALGLYEVIRKALGHP